MNMEPPVLFLPLHTNEETFDSGSSTSAAVFSVQFSAVYLQKKMHVEGSHEHYTSPDLFGSELEGILVHPNDYLPTKHAQHASNISGSLRNEHRFGLHHLCEDDMHVDEGSHEHYTSPELCGSQFEGIPLHPNDCVPMEHGQHASNISGSLRNEHRFGLHHLCEDDLHVDQASHEHYTSPDFRRGQFEGIPLHPNDYLPTEYAQHASNISGSLRNEHWFGLHHLREDDVHVDQGRYEHYTSPDLWNTFELTSTQYPNVNLPTEYEQYESNISGSLKNQDWFDMDHMGDDDMYVNYEVLENIINTTYLDDEVMQRLAEVIPPRVFAMYLSGHPRFAAYHDILPSDSHSSQHEMDSGYDSEHHNPSLGSP